MKCLKIRSKPSETGAFVVSGHSRKASALAPDPHSGSSGHRARAVKRPRQHSGEGRYLNPVPLAGMAYLRGSFFGRYRGLRLWSAVVGCRVSFSSALHRRHSMEGNMSDQTKAAVEAAISAHIADEFEGNILTDWALVIASTTFEGIGSGSTDYMFEANVGQPPHVSYGLLSYALQSSVWDEEDD